MALEIGKALSLLQRRRLYGIALCSVAALATVYVAVAYIVVPGVWYTSKAHHPALDDAPRISHTRSGIPGDPLNLALIGTEDGLVRAILKAGWLTADRITWRSSLHIASATLLRRPDDEAPVSNLFVWGRKQDLAFEQPVGGNPRQRNHVRFWRSDIVDDVGRPLWLGGATYDTKVGFSHTTGQITHHISADVDKERDKLLQDLQDADTLIEIYWLDGFPQKLEGRNGGGDRYYTDGRLPVGVIGEPKDPR